VTFDPNAAGGPFTNQATVSAVSPQSTTVTDLSNNGLDSDPNGNGDPDEPGENVPTPITISVRPVEEIPLAGGTGLLLLAVLLGACGVFVLRRLV
jgi:hypothetical protein